MELFDIGLSLVSNLLKLEFIGLLVKPFALMIRLFANMSGGHMVVLSFMGIIFFFAGEWGSGAGWGNEFEVFKIRLTDFTRNGSPLNLSNIVAVRFEFGPSHGDASGRLGMDDIQFTND